MIEFDWKGVVDLISGSMVALTTSQLPQAFTLLVAAFLLSRGLDKMLAPLDLPDMTFLIDGGADLIAALILFIGTIPVLPEAGTSYAGILMLKGGWTYVQEM